MTKRALGLGIVVVASGIAWGGCSGKSEDAPALVKTDEGDSGVVVEPDASSQAPKDSGSDVVDSAPPDAGKPGVEIKYGACEPFTKCGGDILGTWKVSGGCLSSESFAAVKAFCAGFTESDIVIKARGTLTFTATNVTRDAEIDFSGKATVPKSCLEPPFNNCNVIAAGLKSGLIPGAPKFDQVECTDVGETCNCAVSTTLIEKNDGAYTKKGDGTIAADRDYDYCVKAGPRLQYIPAPNPDAGATAALKLVIEHTR